MAFKKIKLSPLKVGSNYNNDIKSMNQLLFSIFKSNEYKPKKPRKDSFIKLTGKLISGDKNILINKNQMAGKKILSRNFNIKDILNNNNCLPYNKLLKKSTSVNSIYLSSELPIQNKYYSDIISSEGNNEVIINNIPNKQPKINDMKSMDDKISRLAKDLNLLKNKNNSASKINNNLNPEELSEYLKKQNFSSRISSGKFISLEKRLKRNGSRLIQSSKNIFTPSSLIYKLNLKDNNMLSPLNQRERDKFLYEKIFNYFGRKKTEKDPDNYIDNKYNLCYAENEEQFQKKIMSINHMNRIKRTGKEHKIGQTNVELQSFKLQKNIMFIRKIFDYVYPNIFIQKIRESSKAMKKNFKEKSLNNNINEINFPNNKLLLQKYYNNMKLCGSLNIQKVDYV